MRISGSVGCPAGASGPAARRGLSSVGAGGMAQDFQFLWRELWPARPQGAHTESSVVVVDRASARGEVILMYTCQGPRSHLPGKAARVRIEHGILSPLVVIDKRCLSGTRHRRPDCRRYRLLFGAGLLRFMYRCGVAVSQFSAPLLFYLASICLSQTLRFRAALLQSNHSESAD